MDLATRVGPGQPCCDRETSVVGLSIVDIEEKEVTSAFEQARRREQAEQVAYWRYQLIRDPADPGLSPRARGRLVRTLAATVHRGPFGDEVRVSRQTLDRWIRAWRRGGFTALQPPPRPVTPRTPTDVLDLAAALKREQPDRTAAQVAPILRAH